MARHAVNDHDALLDAANRGEAPARQRLVALTVEQIAQERVDRDLARRTVERKQLDEKDARERDESAKRDRVAALTHEARGLAASVQGRWDTAHILPADDLARLVALFKEHYALTTARGSLYVSDRVAEWTMCRLAELIPWQAPYLIERRRRGLTLGQALGVEALPTRKEA